MFARRLADRAETALGWRFAFPAAMLLLAAWEAIALFGLLADYPLLFGDDPIYVLSGLRPFELDWRRLGGMHPHPVANPGILLSPFLSASGCEWGGGDLPACARGLKAFLVIASLAPLAGLYWLMRRWVSQRWALVGMLATGLLSNGLMSLVVMSASSLITLGAAFAMFRAVLDLADGGGRRDWLLVCALPVIAATSSLSMATVFGTATAVAVAYRLPAWRTLAPPLAIGAVIAAAINAPVYWAVRNSSAGALILDGIQPFVDFPPWILGAPGDIFYTLPSLLAALGIAVGMMFAPRYRPLGVMVIALYVCAAYQSYDRLGANVALRASQALAVVSIGIVVAGIEGVWRRYCYRDRLAAVVLVGVLVASVALYKPLEYVGVFGKSAFRYAHSADMVEAARAFADDQPEPPHWIFPGWHEAVVYTLLYDERVHGVYGMGGNAKITVAARSALGMLGDDDARIAALEELGATHAFLLVPTLDYSGWGEFFAAVDARAKELYGEPVERGKIAEHPYFIYQLR